MKKLLVVSAIIFNCFYLSAQQYLDFGFQRELSVPVKDSLLNILKNPWGGGMNACQFSPIDLNLDGIKDLFVYDRSSSKILTFINNGTPNTIDYTFAPEYAEKFPPISDWAQLLDYNCDGKEDIFTYGYGSGGITVYKNISDPVNGLKFELITKTINSQQGPNYTNLLVTQVDYPAIADLDNDGDLDILTFFGLGSYVEFHQNMSEELYGNCDSLTYKLQDYCWGNFAESASSNKITLNITCPYKSNDIFDNNHSLHNGAKHTGSTLLATDLNGDNAKDLLLGDVSFPGIIKLINDSSSVNANMISQDTLFPSNSTTVNIISFPVPCILDVNNDNKKDLIVSPFEPNLLTTQNLKSCWYYKNDGTDSNPVFNFQSDSFLQSDMIDVGGGAYPVLSDYDGDGLLDLFIGNFGKIDSTYFLYGSLNATFISSIALYKNVGTISNPSFQFVTNDFANISQRKITGVVPTFGDINSDGVPEMIIGKSDGWLDLYSNTAEPGEPMNMVLSQTKYMGIHLGYPANQNNPSSAPQLIDLDGDSLLDLVIGEKNGNLNYYKNTGTKYNPVFTFVTDSLGHIDIVDHAMSNYGYSIPCFFKDSTNHWKLFVGSESGNIFYYKNIENNLNGNFTLADPKLGFIYNGMRCGITVGNLNNDNYPDLITGNLSGGVCYYKGVFPPMAGIINYNIYSDNSFTIFPNPSDNCINIDLNKNIFSENNSVTIHIIDIMGNTIIKKEVNSSPITIDVKELSNGLYFCNVTSITNNKNSPFSKSAKFIIQH